MSTQKETYCDCLETFGKHCKNCPNFISTQPMIEEIMKDIGHAISTSSPDNFSDVKESLMEAYTLGTQDAIEEIGKIVIWSRKQEDMVKTALGIMQYLENLPKTSLTEQEK